MNQILFVDDDENILHGLRRRLRSMRPDWQMVFATSAAEALELSKSMQIDVIVSDIQMPGMDGRQTTEAIRHWEHTSGNTPLPIIALTAHALANEKRSLLQSGLDDYLTKPISDRQLAQVVLKWTGLALRSQPQRQAETSTQPQPEPLPEPQPALKARPVIARR